MDPLPSSCTDDFEAAWKKFSQTADNLLSPKPTSCNATKGKRRQRRKRPQPTTDVVAVPLTPKQLQRILSLLLSLSKLLSSVTTRDKAHASQNGALGIIVRACDSVLLNQDSKGGAGGSSGKSGLHQQILQSGCKVLQTCVFKNAAARALCIYHGILNLLARIIAHAQSQPELQDDAYTTLAAVCLGNDRNALVACQEFEPLVQRSLDTARASNNGRLQQTLSYLETLFRVVKREQKELLDRLAPEAITEIILTADRHLQTALVQQRNHQWTQAEASLAKALEEAQKLADHSKNLVDDMLGNILEQRSAVRLQLQNWDGVLADIRSHSAVQSATAVPPLHLLARRADALVGLERFEEAQAALDEGIQIAATTDESLPRKALVHKRNQVQLAKLKAERRRKPERSAQQESAANTGESESETTYLPTTAPEEESTLTVKPGASVNCLYGMGVVQEVRKCGTTKIKLKSWFPGRQAPTAYLMPEFYTLVIPAVSE